MVSPTVTSLHSSDDYDDDGQFSDDVSLEMNALNSTLVEQSVHDVSNNVNISSLFLRELLLKQEESHRKIRELQETIQTRVVKTSSLPCLPNSMPSSNTSLHDSQTWYTESSVSLEPFMATKQTFVEHQIEDLNEGQHGDCEGNDSRKRHHSIDSITTLGSYKELNLTQGDEDEMSNNSHGDNSQLSKQNMLSPRVGVSKATNSETNLLEYGIVKEQRLNNNIKSCGDVSEERRFDYENNNTSAEYSESSDVNTTIEEIFQEQKFKNTREKYHDLEPDDTKIDCKAQLSLDKSKFHSPNFGNDSVSQTFIIPRHHSTITEKSTEKTTSPDNIPEDELTLCIDIMAARIKELELEKERVKLDVIVALKKKFDCLLFNNSHTSEKDKEVPAKFFQELNESVYEITLDEVTKIKREEREKHSKIEEGYKLQIQKLSKELENLAQEKCELLVEISNCKQKTQFLEDRQSKYERTENRTDYLESLLRNVESENLKLKEKVETLETESLELQQQNRTLTSSLNDFKHKLELSASSEASTKKFYNDEHQKLLDENRRTKDDLFQLQSQFDSLKQEKQRVVNSKETDVSIIKHLEEKLKRQGTVLENVTADSNKHFEANLKLENKLSEYKQKLKKSALGIETTQQQNKNLQDTNASLEREKSELKKTVTELKQRESDCSFQLTKLKTEFERQQNIWNSQRDHLERKLNTLITITAPSNGIHGNGVTNKNDPQMTILQSFPSQSNSKYNDDSFNITRNKTNPIIHPNNYGTHSIDSDVIPSPRSNMVTKAADQIPFKSHSTMNKLASPIDLINSGNNESHFLSKSYSSVNPVKSTQPPYYEFSSSGSQDVTSLLQNPVLNTNHGNNPKITPVKDTYLQQIPSSDVRNIHDTSGVRKTPFKSKYTADDTRMFLKEMKYKLEQTEAAMKLADSADSSVNLSSNNFDTLPNRINKLRNEVMNLS